MKLTKLRGLKRLEIYETNVSEETYRLFRETYEKIWKKQCSIEGSMDKFELEPRRL